MMEQMFHLAWRKVTAVTDKARKALSTRDDAMVTLEQLSAASAEPIEHLRNYVLAGVLTCDERGMFPLRSSLLAILDFWEWKGASRLMVPPLPVQPLRLRAVIRISEKAKVAVCGHRERQLDVDQLSGERKYRSFRGTPAASEALEIEMQDS